MSLVLVQDSREKAGKHNNIEAFFQAYGIPIIRKTLSVGDYRLAEVQNGTLTYLNNIAVDIKGVGGLLELAGDLYRDKKAFNKKYRKCYHEGISLYVLVEEPIKTVSQLLAWNSPRTKITGKHLYDMMYTLKVSYGVKFRFCSREESPTLLLDILQGKDTKGTGANVNNGSMDTAESRDV